MKTILKGKGFLLRPIRMSDAQKYFECFRGKNIELFLIKVPKNLAEAKKDLRKKVRDLGKKNPFGETFAIVVGGEFAGYIELHHLNLEHAVHKGEIGYALRPEFRGKGLTPRAIKLVTDYAFKKYKLKRISAMGRLKNEPSARVLEKAGYKLEGILRKNKCIRGQYLDDFIYEKIK